MNKQKITYCRYFIFLFFLIGGVDAYAQDGLSLSEAIEIGLRNNFQIAITEKEKEIAMNNNNYAEAGRYPTVDFNISTNNIFIRQKNPTPIQQLDQASYIIGPASSTAVNGGLTATIDASWVLFDGFKVRINKNRLEELERQTFGYGQIVIEHTIQSIILAYNQVLIEREQLEAMNEVLLLTHDRIDFQDKKKKYGMTSKFDIIQTKDAHLTDSLTILVQQNNYKTALQNLNYSMGIDNNKKFELTDKLAYSIKTYKYSDLKRKMLSNNKQLTKQLIQQKLAGIETNLAKSNRYPSIHLNTGAGYGINRFRAIEKEAIRPPESINGNNFNYYLNLSATYPLFDAGKRKRAIQNAKVNEEIALLNIDDLKRKLSSELQKAFDNYNNQRELLKIMTELLENAKENLALSAEQFRSGEINSFNYRSVQLSYLHASQSYLHGIFNLRNTEMEMTRLTGALVR